MNPVIANEVLKHNVVVSNPVPLWEALLILGGFVVFCGLLIKFGVPWIVKEMNKW